MTWRNDSGLGLTLSDTEPLSEADILARDEEIRWLMQHERHGWGLINGRIAGSGDPVANVGTYTSIAAYPPANTLANVASLSGEAALWSSNIYSPWLADALLSPTAWRIYASWQSTTAATPANLTINPRIGSFAAGASTTGGIQMGADAAITLTASIASTVWSMEGSVTVQSIGIPGTNSKAIGAFNVMGKPATTGNGALTVNDQFGYTQASFDSSVASGFVLGMANTVTTITYSVQQVHWIAL